MSNPLVSICIPTFNGAPFLQEAMESVKNQTYNEIEVVVSDDASTDNTLAIISKFKEEVAFPVTIVSHKPNGIGANWNNCLKNAQGPFIKFLFQDDVLMPTCVEEMVAVFTQHPHLGLVCCKREFIVEKEKSNEIEEWIYKFKNLQVQFEEEKPITIIDKTLFQRKDFLDSPMNKIGEPPTVLFKKEMLQQVGFFDENLKQILDYVFYYRILKNYPIAIINKPLVKFRIHKEQATNVNRNKPIADYEIYKKILYKEFLPLLHPSHKKKLVLKFSKTAQLKKKLKSVLRKLRT
jgi:glycosyltransferase involved in cell wall biosynthesis